MEKETKKDLAQEILEEMINDGNPNYAESACSVDKVRDKEEPPLIIKKK